MDFRVVRIVAVRDHANLFNRSMPSGFDGRESYLRLRHRRMQTGERQLRRPIDRLPIAPLGRVSGQQLATMAATQTGERGRGGKVIGEQLRAQWAAEETQWKPFRMGNPPIRVNEPLEHAKRRLQRPVQLRPIKHAVERRDRVHYLAPLPNVKDSRVLHPSTAIQLAQ